MWETIKVYVYEYNFVKQTVCNHDFSLNLPYMILPLLNRLEVRNMDFSLQSSLL